MDIVFQQTRHGSLDAGVNRDATVPVGHCLQCHERAVQPSTNAPMLFHVNDNTLCFTCHQGPGKAVYLGQTAYNGTAHANTANSMLWPGPTPPARPATDKGECLNCHTPHGYRDGVGLVPNLEYVREEALCLACHDSTGPASTNVQADVVKASAHPVVSIAGKHVSTESQAGATFAGANRHAECVDCHNPHAANDTAKLGGVARVGVTNGAAGATATFTLKPASDGSAVKEYELCFKCHASYTTLPAGKTDKAVELNPANASFHPVEAAGKNATAAMNASLAGGTGLPHLTATSVITCADCHGSDALPTTVSSVSAYTGAGAHRPARLGQRGAAARPLRSHRQRHGGAGDQLRALRHLPRGGALRGHQQEHALRHQLQAARLSRG